MSRPAQIEPRWLVGLMSQWVLRQTREGAGGLGFPSRCPMMAEAVGNPARARLPVGFSGVDFRDLEAALQALHAHRVEWWVAMMMYYRPWSIASLELQGFPFGCRVYRDRRQRAHAWVADHMEAAKTGAERHMALPA